MVVLRFHDHWHAHRPDGIFTGMVEALGWEKYQSANARLLTLPATTLKELATEVQSKLKIRTIRVIGDPETKVSTIAFNPGYNSSGRGLSREGVDVMMIGEAREWEGIAVRAGLNRLRSEEGNDRARPCHFGGGRHGQLREMAQDVYQRGSD